MLWFAVISGLVLAAFADWRHSLFEYDYLVWGAACLMWPFVTTALFIGTHIGTGLRRTELVFTSSGLQIGGAVIPLESIVSFGLEEKGGKETVCATLFIRLSLGKVRRLSFVLDNREDARKFLDLMPQSAFPSSFEEDMVLLRTGILAPCLMTSAAILAITLRAEWPLVFCLLAAASIFFACAFPLTHICVRIAQDGVVISSVTGRRFLSFLSLQTITFDNGKVLLKLNSGAIVQLHVTAMMPPGYSPSESGRLLAARLTSALGSFRDAQRAIPPIHELSVIERAREVLSRGAIAADYRTANPTASQLGQLLANPAVPPAVRLSSAIAWKAEAPGGAIPEVLAAATVTAHPKLRVALETVANEGRSVHLTDCLKDLIAEEEEEMSTARRKG